MRYAKYVDMAARNMIAHDERSFLCLKEHIDSSRSSQNYNLAPDRGCSSFEYYKKRLSEVKCQKRDDVNTYCQWVVTLPKDYPLSMADGFFRESYEYLKEKYGEKNIISAYVHYDEATPHMHFAFVPVVKGIKKSKRRGPTEIEKVCAKECVTEFDLKTMHPRMQEHLEEVLKRPVNLLNEATKAGNKAIKELKRRTAVQRLEDASKTIAEMTAKAKKVVDDLQTVADATVSEDTFRTYWKEKYGNKWDYKRSLGFIEYKNKVELNTDDFNDLYADLEKYYTLSKDLALKNKKLAENISHINTNNNNLCQQMQLMMDVDRLQRELAVAGQRYNKAIKNDQKLREQIQDLQVQVKKAVATAEQAQKELSATRGVADIGCFFGDLCKAYPQEIKNIADRYCKSTNQSITIKGSGGFELAFGTQRVKDMGMNIN